jgi:hypothetical protein
MMTVDIDPDVARDMERQRRTIVALTKNIAYWRDLAMADDYVGSRADMRGGEPAIPNDNILALPPGWAIEVIPMMAGDDMAVIYAPEDLDMNHAVQIQQVWRLMWRDRPVPPLLLLKGRTLALEHFPAAMLAGLCLKRVPPAEQETADTIRAGLSDVMGRIESRFGASVLLSQAQSHIETAMRLMTAYKEESANGR